MHLRWCLAFLEAKGAFHICAEHIRGRGNGITDVVSRNNLAFLEAKGAFHICAEHIRGRGNGITDVVSRNNLFPQADEVPTVIMEAVLEVLVGQQQDQSSPNWTML